MTVLGAFTLLLRMLFSSGFVGQDQERFIPVYCSTRPTLTCL